jgi:hypothetical protein
VTRDLTNPDDTWWTIDQTAEHFGVKRRTILDWIRANDLHTYGKAKLIRRTEALTTFRARRKKQNATRYRS